MRELEMDQLRAMRVFVKVVEEGSFVAAARSFDWAPAVVTRLVVELEEHLGARLLNRTTRKLALTDAGTQYFERARQVLLDVDDADAQLSAAATEPRGQVRVLLPPAFAVHQLAKRLPEFRARCPHIALELTVLGAVDTVDDNHDVSILMVRDPLTAGDFVARRIARSEIILAASPEYLARRGVPQLPQDLMHHDLLLPALASVRREVVFQRGHVADDEPPGEVLTLQPQAPVLASAHVDTLYAAALANMGVAGLPSFVAEDALLEHALERVLPQWHLFHVNLYAAMPTRKHVPARTRAFVDFLVQTFGGGDDDPWLVSAGCPTVNADPSVQLPKRSKRAPRDRVFGE
jgi:DNA-binding transcriptional LysR family regulator